MDLPLPPQKHSRSWCKGNLLRKRNWTSDTVMKCEESPLIVIQLPRVVKVYRGGERDADSNGSKESQESADWRWNGRKEHWHWGGVTTLFKDGNFSVFSGNLHSSCIRFCRARFWTWCSPTFENQNLLVPHLSVGSGPRWLLTPGFGMLLDLLSPSQPGIAKTLQDFVSFNLL